tara:strand:+ start:1696 stop:2118 length:423 start_codon:yes stop_codon:yes gene_type:complete
MAQRPSKKKLTEGLMQITPGVRDLYKSYFKYANQILGLYDDLCEIREPGPWSVNKSDMETISKLEELSRDCLVGIRGIHCLENYFFDGNITSFEEHALRFIKSYKTFSRKCKSIDKKMQILFDKIECREKFNFFMPPDFI